MRTIASAMRMARQSGSAPQQEPETVATVARSRFEVAAERAMALHSPSEWALLEPTKRTDAIYAELRRLDTEFSTKAGAHKVKR